MPLHLMPINYADACTFVRTHHRHLSPPQGHKFSIGVTDGSAVIGVIIVGRPVARHQDDGLTLEVTRCCTTGARNACSKLYAAAWQATRALGYTRLITYTLAEESGGSLRAAGLRVVGQTRGGEWNTPSRPRPKVEQPGVKTLWQYDLTSP